MYRLSCSKQMDVLFIDQIENSVKDRALLHISTYIVLHNIVNVKNNSAVKIMVSN